MLKRVKLGTKNREYPWKILPENSQINQRSLRQSKILEDKLKLSNTNFSFPRYNEKHVDVR